MLAEVLIAQSRQLSAVHQHGCGELRGQRALKRTAEMTVPNLLQEQALVVSGVEAPDPPGLQAQANGREQAGSRQHSARRRAGSALELFEQAG